MGGGTQSGQSDDCQKGGGGEEQPRVQRYILLADRSHRGGVDRDPSPSHATDDLSRSWSWSLG